MSEERNEQAKYWDDVKGIVSDVKQEVESGNLEDWDSVVEYTEQSVDSSQRVIYTWQAKMAVIYSDNADAYFDTFGEEGAVKDGTIDWSALAYCAVLADVWELLSAEGIDRDYWDSLEEEEDARNEGYYVGASSNPLRPCIISGPFDAPPDLMGGHFLYKQNTDGTWELIR